MPDWSTPQGDHSQFNLSPIVVKSGRVFEYVGFRECESGFCVAVWRAQCKLCAAPFEIMTLYGVRSGGSFELVTCKEHRGQTRKRRDPSKPQKSKRFWIMVAKRRRKLTNRTT